MGSPSHSRAKLHEGLAVALKATMVVFGTMGSACAAGQAIQFGPHGRQVVALPAEACTSSNNPRETSVWAGVYTTEQAERGQRVYRQYCSTCHGRELEGDVSGPPLAGMDFLDSLDGKALGTLLERVRTTMPADNPDGLSGGAYVDVITYILQQNSFPTGERELTAEQLDLGRILITKTR